MTDHVGVVRDRRGLIRALEVISAIEAKSISRQMRNRLITAKLIAVAALRREESRGAHFRSDFPEPRAELARRNYLTLVDAEAELVGLVVDQAPREALAVG